MQAVGLRAAVRDQMEWSGRGTARPRASTRPESHRATTVRTPAQWRARAACTLETLVKGYKHSDMELKAMTQRIRAHFPTTVVLQVSNFGMDIAGFLAVVKEMLHLKATHKVLLKLHSKTKKYWRDKMLEGVCATPNLVHKILDRFSQDETAAMLGSRDYCWYMDLNDQNLISEHYAPRFKLNTSFYDIWDSQRLAHLPYDGSEYINNRQVTSLLSPCGVTCLVICYL